MGRFPEAMATHYQNPCMDIARHPVAQRGPPGVRGREIIIGKKKVFLQSKKNKKNNGCVHHILNRIDYFDDSPLQESSQVLVG